jgi:hypothetical protein
VLGPLRADWYIAQGKLQGQLFYNTYTSPQANNNGAVMRLHLGAAQPEVLLTQPGIPPLGPCWSCHSLGAQGTMLVAQSHLYPGGPFLSASFDLLANPGLQPPTLAQPVDFEMGLGAVYPDGSKVLTMGSPAVSNESLFFPYGRGNIPAMIGPRDSALLDTRTGNRITVNGWNVRYAKMPSFSPDGSRVAFNWHDTGNGHSLGVAEFDTSTNTMSNTREIFRHDTLFPGWPFLTPDNKAVIFVLGNPDDYVSSIPFGRADRPIMASSELWIFDIDTKEARPLARANGYPQAGAATYLPRAGRDEHLEFFPTISPVGSGGYFWLFFTSRRTYGSTITQPSEDPITKKIWVSAINIRPPGTGPIADPSYPAFYLPGQEAAAGNIRAFAALEPCRQDGDACETGIDCCNGQCNDGRCGPPLPPPPTCTEAPPQPPPCRNLDERCNVKADCCNERAECIGHYCTIIEPPR